MLGFLVGFIGKIFGSAASAAGSVVTSMASAGGELVSKGGDAVAGAFKDPGDLQSARQFAAPSAGAGWFRSFVDGINCAIRPAIVVYLCGLIAGYWSAPDLAAINAVYVEWFEKVMVFYFGQRAVVYDAPRLIAGLRSAFRA